MKKLFRFIGGFFAVVIYALIVAPVKKLISVVKWLCKPTGKLRMAEWLLLSMVLYGCAFYIQHPQIQTALWKAGHINTAAFLGYWIARKIFGRFDSTSDPIKQLARGVVIAACIIGMALGL